jgi:hypothetical protein
MLLFIQPASFGTNRYVNIVSVDYVDQTGSIKFLSARGIEHLVRRIFVCFSIENTITGHIYLDMFKCLLYYTLQRLKVKKNYNCAPR